MAVAATFPDSRVTVENSAAAKARPKPKIAMSDRFQISGMEARAKGRAGAEAVMSGPFQLP